MRLARLAGLRAAGARALLPSGAAVGAGAVGMERCRSRRCWAGTGGPSSSAQRKLSASGAPHGGACCPKAHQLRLCASAVADRSADRAGSFTVPADPRSPFPCQRPSGPSRHAAQFLHRSLRSSGAPHRCCSTPTAAAAAAAARLLARGPPTCCHLSMPCWFVFDRLQVISTEISSSSRQPWARWS